MTFITYYNYIDNFRFPSFENESTVRPKLPVKVSDWWDRLFDLPFLFFQQFTRF